MTPRPLPARADMTICFAHAAYRMTERFEARNSGIRHVEARSLEALRSRIPEADVVVVSGLWRNELIAAAPRLAFVQSISAGIDQYDRSAFEAAGIRLASAQGANERAVAEHAAQPDHPVVDPAQLTPAQKTLRRHVHETIQKVGDDYGRRHSFNTAIASLMELLNHVTRFTDLGDQGRAVRHEALEAMVLLLNPVTPHASHALWQVLGHPETLLEDVPFPKADPAALVRDRVTLAVQVNGKLRGTIEAAPDAPREAIEAAALAEPNVARFLEGQAVRKVIVVPGKIVNIVAG